MANVIKTKKGLDTNLKGKALDVLLNGGKSESYVIVPDYYSGILPKVVAKVGEKVKANSVLMIDRNRPEIKFVSPVSGGVTAVNRGEKREVLNIAMKPDAQIEYEEFGKKNVASLQGAEVKETPLNAGMWPSIKQRPYDIIVAPLDTPRDIFVSTFYSTPLAPNFGFIVGGQEADLQTGLNALAKLTDGKMYVGVRSGSVVSGMKGAEIVEVKGPHPAANVGVQINYIRPVNKDKVVWTVSPADVIVIGCSSNKGVADFSRMVAITGSETTERGYVKTISGCTTKSLVNGKVLGQEYIRIISDNVLTGTKVDMDGYLGAYDNQITVIPESDETHEFLGFAMPRFSQFSASRSYFSWLGTSKEYVVDARIKGGKRAMITPNEYDKVFPMDICPEYLLKAIITFDIDKMENLGIYEVAPEGFAFCEFVDTSKIELQKIVCDGLNLLYKEMN